MKSAASGGPDSLTIEVKFYDDPNVHTYNIPWTAGLTIQSAMEACYNEYSGPHSQSPFTFVIQYYGTYSGTLLGYMTIAVNNRYRSDPYLWFVYLNGTLTNNSLDGSTLNPGDVVEFKFQQYSDAPHGKTNYSLMRIVDLSQRKN